MRSLQQSGRFIDHVFRDYKQAVISIPCGAGKTLHSVLYAASHADPDNKFLIIVPDRRTLLELRKGFRKLGITVGVYTGFNGKECHGLTGQDYTYLQCLRGHRDSKCKKCRKKSKCWYGNSGSAFKHNIVLTTHLSFIILCEKGRDFSDRTIIIDESPAVFTTEEFTAEELFVLRDILVHSSFPAIRKLLTDLLPFVMIRSIGMPRTFFLNELSEIKLVKLAERITPQILKTLFRFAFSEGCPEYHHTLFFRFLMFIRTAAECGASVAVAVFHDRIVLKKLRIDFRVFCSFKRLYILDASSNLSQLVFPKSMPVLTCSELKPDGFVRLHVVIGNPTKSRRAMNMEAGLDQYQSFMEAIGPKGKLLLSHNPDGYLLDQVLEALSEDSDVVSSSIGYLRGTNIFSDCMLAFFASTGVFTSIDDCAMTIALQEQQNIPWSRFMVIDEDGHRRPRMDATGCFSDSAMQRLFMAVCIDKLYQAVYRTAVRKGETVDVFMPIPSIDWLIPLQKLMPCEVVSAKGNSQLRETAFTGVSQLVNLSAGTELSKKEAAELCGYQTWKQAKRTLRKIFDRLFDCTEKTLIRKEDAV